MDDNIAIRVTKGMSLFCTAASCVLCCGVQFTFLSYIYSDLVNILLFCNFLLGISLNIRLWHKIFSVMQGATLNLQLISVFITALPVKIPNRKYHHKCTHEWSIPGGLCTIPCVMVLFNLLKTKRNLLCIRNQFVPHSKHFPPRL